jgi:hypothetical protein
VADLASLQIEINASRALDQAKAVTHALGEVGKAGEQAALAFSFHTHQLDLPCKIAVKG